MQLTQEMVEEFNKCKNDIIYFTERYINHNTVDGIKPLELYPYQVELLDDDCLTAQTSRQIGFSLMAYAKIVHSIIFNNQNTIVFYWVCRDRVRYSLEQIVMLFELCSICEELKPKLITKNKHELRFDNMTRVLGASNYMHLRGYSFSEIYMEEVDFYKEPIHEFICTIMPVILSRNSYRMWSWSSLGNGNLDILKDYLSKYRNFKHYNLPWYVIPNRTSNWKSRQKEYIGDDNFNREFNNKLT
jgi:hypothetical protein